jgi:putative transposase
MKIFRSDKDRHRFLDLLALVITRFCWLCHGYCLMGNHYHLFVETPQANLSRGMRHLNGVYTQWWNAKYQNTGHLFQGRYKAVIVDKDAYLCELSRYLALNPVRAKMVEKPGDWRWSHFRALSGEETAPEWLTTQWVLTQFSDDADRAQVLYREFVLAGIAGVNPWTELRGQIFLGEKEFIEKVKSRSASVIPQREVPISQRYAERPALSDLFLPNFHQNRATRNAAITKAFLDYGYTLKEIADHLGMHYATLSRIIKAEQMS